MKTKNLFLILMAVVAVGVMSGLIDALAGTGLVMALPAGLAGIKSLKALKEERAGKWDALEALVNKAKEEKRDLTEDEVTEKRNLLDAMDELDESIADAERMEKRAAQMAGAKIQKDVSKKEVKDLRSYSFVKAMREHITGKLTGLEAEMAQEGAKELKEEVNEESRGFVVPKKVLQYTEARASTGQNITTDADGGNLAVTLPTMYVEALKNELVLPGLGTRFLTGLNGKLPIVRGGSFTATWATEGTAVAVTKMSTSKITMEAHRVTASGAFSLELLRQASPDVEMLVRSELISANAQAILTGAINGSGSSGEPTGILNTSGIGDVAGGTNGLAPTWAHMVSLETEVAQDNAMLGSLAYLTNAKVRGKTKQTLKSSGVAGYIWDGNEINGYKAAVTNAVPSDLDKGTSTGVCSAIIFGSWDQLLIGDWGGLDIVVDPFSKKFQADVEIAVHSFADVAVRHPQSFAAMLDALTV